MGGSVGGGGSFAGGAAGVSRARPSSSAQADDASHWTIKANQSLPRPAEAGRPPASRTGKPASDSSADQVGRFAQKVKPFVGVDPVTSCFRYMGNL